MESVVERQPIQAEVGTYLKLLLICAIFLKYVQQEARQKQKNLCNHGNIYIYIKFILERHSFSLLPLKDHSTQPAREFPHGN